MQIKNSSNSRINIKDNLKIFKKYLKKQKAKIFLGSSIIGGSIILFFPFKNLSKLEISFFGKITNAQELIYRALPSDGVFEPIYNYVKFGNSLADLGYRYIKSNILIPANSMQINIKLDDYQTLLEKRNMALKDGILTRSKDDEVNSIINFNNKNYKVKIRLKGDWVDHIKDDKWSFRIKVRGDKSIMGMKEFSLQHPRSRNYINEYIFHKILKHEGIPSLRYEFINLSLNGKRLGIYALEEHFDKILIENNGFREGPIIKFSEDALWQSRKDLNVPFTGLYNTDNSQIEPFNANKLTLNEKKLSQFFLAKELLKGYLEKKLKTSEVFDNNLLAKYVAISDLLNANHNLIWHNLRFYFNPITSRLVPIGFDAQPKNNIKSINLSMDNNRFQLFNDEKFVDKYIKELNRISKKSFMIDIKNKYQNDFNNAVNKLNMSYPFISFDFNYLDKRQELLRKRLKPALPISSNHYKNLLNNNNNNIELSLSNNSKFPLEITEIEHKNISYKPKNKIILPNQNQSKSLIYSNYIFKSNGSINNKPKNSANLNEHDFLIRFKVKGVNEEQSQLIRITPYTSSTNIENLIVSRKENSDSFPFLKHNHSEKTIYIKEGNWIIDKPLILPNEYKLIANSKISIEFLENTFLMATGPVSLVGDKDYPIKFKGDGGLIVIDSNNSSRIENVIFENLKSPKSFSTLLTAGVNFYNSPVSIKNAEFRSSQSEDAINLFRSNFTISSSKFIDINSDAVDIDFSDGIIKNTLFNNIRNDAVDISGSEVNTDNLIINNVLDKAFSAGEQSKISINNSLINSASIGIASKDLSLVNVTNSNLKSIELCFTAYEKKSEYGASELVIKNSKFECEKKYLLEPNSQISINSFQQKYNVKEVSKLLYGADYGKASVR